MKSRGIMRILQQNCWVDKKDKNKRTEELVRGILEMDPEIACLQEVVTGDVRQSLWENLSKRYHILHTQYGDPELPPLAYFPCGLLAFITLISTLLGGGNQSIMRVTLLCFTTASLCPRGMFSCVNRLIRKREHPGLDLMGQTILVRRRAGEMKTVGWDSAEIVGIHPFPHEMRGYPSPKSIRDAVFYWVQHCFIRPGFIVVRATGGIESCKEALILSAHLVVSEPGKDKNPNRLQQVKYMNSVLNNHILKDKMISSKESESLIVVAGDFNSPEGSPEIKFMRENGFSDSCASGSSWSVKPKPSFLTWERKLNPYTASNEGEPDNRLDYVFFRGKGIQCEKTERIFDGDNLPLVSDHFGILATLKFMKD